MDDNMEEICSDPGTPVTRSQCKGLTQQNLSSFHESLSDNEQTTTDRFKQRARSFRIAVGTLKQVTLNLPIIILGYLYKYGISFLIPCN